MLGLHAKRGVETTLERVYAATGNQFAKLQVIWSGATAGICTNEKGETLIRFPGISDEADVSNARFHDLIGYALHELGHAWFTDNAPWDAHRGDQFVFRLINGLEDPRIERRVIESGFAGNARSLFETLINSIVRDKPGDYVNPNDIDNVAFQLAIEGRRLNGYAIVKPAVFERSIWAEDIRWALRAAQKAVSTAEIVEVAVELARRLRQQQQQQQQQQSGNDGSDGSQEGEQEGSQEGSQKGNQEGEQDEQQGSGHDGELVPIEPGEHIEQVFRPCVDRVAPSLRNFKRRRIEWRT